MMTNHKLLITILIFGFCEAFNISPVPNIVFKIPDNSSQVSSPSLFGYSVNLRKNSVFIGAPRDNSSFIHTKIYENGKIYKCDLNNGSSCFEFNVESESHLNDEKNFQMLGMNIDGGKNDNDQLLTCAHKYGRRSVHDTFYMMGTCYWMPSVDSRDTSKISMINFIPEMLDMKSKKSSEHHSNSLLGFSAELYDDGKVLALGSPGAKIGNGGLVAMTNTTTNDKTINYDSASKSDLYYGFSVSSFHIVSTNSVILVGSAPRAGQLNGEIRLFDLKTKKIKMILNRDVLGEYLGYDVLIDDLNNNGLPEIYASAPYFSRDGLYEHGRVYYREIIRIKNILNPNSQISRTKFEDSIENKDYKFGGQFGRSMSKLGDINFDGFNDIAISAPYEDGGVVYIYAGEIDIKSIKVYQKIQVSTFNFSPLPQNPMFGEGLSKGNDIDGNGYEDFAIGAPNLESLFVYKSYPIVNIISNITSFKNQISLDDTEFIIKICSNFTSKTKQLESINITRNATLESRLSFSNTHSVTEKLENLQITKQGKCANHTLYIMKTDVKTSQKKPLKIIVSALPELTIPNEPGQYCDECFVVMDIQKIDIGIPYNTGCKKEKCEPDLALEGKFINVMEPYITGSTNEIQLEYTIKNFGEYAYFPFIEFTIPTRSAKFVKPAKCSIIDHHNHKMKCNIIQASPMKPNATTTMKLTIDTKFLSGPTLEVQAEAKLGSFGEDKNISNNFVVNKLKLISMSHLSVIGTSSKSYPTDYSKFNVLNFDWEITNNGPSQLESILIDLYVPTKYGSSDTKLVEITEINVYLKDENRFISSYGLDEDENDSSGTKMINWSPFGLTTNLVEPENVTTAKERNSIHMNCSDSNIESSLCEVRDFSMGSFGVKDDVIVVALKALINLKDLEKLRESHENILVFEPRIVVHSNISNVNLNISMNNPKAIVILTPPFPLKKVLLASFFALFLLILLIKILHKKGFFKREKLETVQDFKRKTAMLTGQALEEYTKRVILIEEAKRLGKPVPNFDD